MSISANYKKSRAPNFANASKQPPNFIAEELFQNFDEHDQSQDLLEIEYNVEDNEQEFENPFENQHQTDDEQNFQLVGPCWEPD